MSEPIVTTFPNEGELARALAMLDALSLPYEVLTPPRAYSRVAVAAVVLELEVFREFGRTSGSGFFISAPRVEGSFVELADVKDEPGLACSGSAPYRPARHDAPADEEPPLWTEDVFGTASVMVFASCLTDQKGVRVTAHLSGDLTDVFPYLNADMATARYNPRGPTLTFMDRHRLITLYDRRIAIAKADDLEDAWRLLEMVRRRANDVWARRHEIEPSHEAQRRPTLFEIVKCLPRTNCRECGEATCTAFAARLLGGEIELSRCRPAWQGEYVYLREALIDLCAGSGQEVGP